MNNSNMQQIFEHYIDNFAMLNDKDHYETYKWQVCSQFRTLMDDALASENDVFADALYKVKKCTYNIIDSYTQPFSGLVALAREDAAGVKNLLKNLYSDDGGDLKVQMKLIADFFEGYNKLLDEYYPDSYLFKQNSHSVSAYLFLYDPDHHYMYKATQSIAMADCIQFYDDWGSGDNINLEIYYRMCDEIVEAIKSSEALRATNQSRYDGRVEIVDGPLHPDAELHILAFDIIWCSNVYDLFDGISFKRPKSKEKQLILAQKKLAANIMEQYKEAKSLSDRLEEALTYFAEIMPVGTVVKHKVYGVSKVVGINSRYIKIQPEGQGEKSISLPIGIANGIISISSDEFLTKKDEYLDVLKKFDSIPRTLEYASRALEPYKEYLE